MFFGKSVALLLVMLFVFSGAQIGLSLVGDHSRGVVLGENDGTGNQGKSDSAPGQNRDEPETVVTQTPVYIAPTTGTLVPASGALEMQQIVVTQMPPEIIPTESVTVTVAPTTNVTATPTIIITPEPTQTSTTSGGGTQTSTTEVQTSSGAVVTTTSEVDRSTGETVKQIVRKFGIYTGATPTPAVAPVIQTAVTVVEEKTAGEILNELAKLPTRSGASRVRLRYKFVNGQMTLVGETDTGEETPLTAAESASIIGRLTRSAALEVKPSGPGESVFTKGQIRAVTDLPLLVDLRTNLLTTETSTGIKTIPLLPDEAIKIAFASRVVDGIYPKKSDAEIEFKEAENGRLVYQIDGLSKRKLFGLLPLTLSETALVDTANGQVTQPEKSLGKLLLELIAFPVK